MNYSNPAPDSGAKVRFALLAVSVTAIFAMTLALVGALVYKAGVERPAARAEEQPAAKKAMTVGEYVSQGGHVEEPPGSDLSIIPVAVAGAFAFVAVYSLFVILPLVWVVRDCRNRSVESGALWLLIVLLFGWLGFAVYVFSRPGGNLVLCLNCRGRRLAYVMKCPHCGIRTRKRVEAAPDYSR